MKTGLMIAAAAAVLGTSLLATGCATQAEVTPVATAPMAQMSCRGMSAKDRMSCKTVAAPSTCKTGCDRNSTVVNPGDQSQY